MNCRNIITSALALATGLFVRPTKAAVPTTPPKEAYWSRDFREYVLFAEDMRTKYEGQPAKQYYSQRIEVVHCSEIKRLASMRANQYWREVSDGWLRKVTVLDECARWKKLPGQQLVVTLEDLKQAI